MYQIIAVALAGVALLAGGVWWSKSMSADDPNVISTAGIHWHPTVEIYVNDEPVEIQANLGLGAVHNPIHTHDDMPIIHLEFEGLVRNDDVTLGKFFEIWGKDFMEFGDSVEMTVNGDPNTELESYVMQDGDRIVLRYTK